MISRFVQLFVYSILLLFLVLFVLMFQSSLSYEVSRADYKLGSSGVKKSPPDIRELTFPSFVSVNPKQIELYIRAFLATSKLESLKNSEKLSDTYFSLLKIRPSWPYYFSGLAQIEKIKQNDFNPLVNKAIMLAPFERKVVMSVSQLLFSNWEGIDSVMKKKMLVYLSSQDEVVIEKLIGSALMFARLFEFCDYLYEINQVEYRTCKREFWQPLLGDA